MAERRVEFVAGLGFSFSSDTSHNGSGDGGFAQAEYVFRPDSAVSPRLYAGALVTFPQRDSCGTPSMCDVESQIGFAGAKVRLMAPIPWVGPYLEIGFGASVGRFRTLDGPTIDESASGVVLHIPWALGLAFGRHHEYDIAFSYLYHWEPKQTGAAFAFGFGFASP